MLKKVYTFCKYIIDQYSRFHENVIAGTVQSREFIFAVVAPGYPYLEYSIDEHYSLTVEFILDGFFASIIVNVVIFAVHMNDSIVTQ